MQADRACPQAISLSVGALISLVFFCAVLAGIAYLMPHFLSISQFSSSLLAPAIAILGAAAGCFLKRHRQRKRHAVPR
jgi:predicted MFS family arabinose efflux permease